MNKIPQHIIDLLNNLSCENVAERLGLNVVKHKSLCFMHDDHHPSLVFTGKNRERWWCFVCNKGGSAINLVMEYTNCSFIESCQWLGQLFNIEIEGLNNNNNNLSSIRISPPKKLFSNEPKPFAKDVVQWILDNYSLTDKAKRFLFDQRCLAPSCIKQLKIVSIDNSWNLIERLQQHFDKEILKESGLVSINNDKMYFRLFTPCLLFPYLDKDGELVGIQSRYLGNNKDAPRFQFISAQKTRVFNMQILNTMNYGDDLYISEGITDCLALLSSGKKAIAIPSATILPLNDLLDLSIYKLHMYPDQDVAGEKAFINLRNYFINHYAILIKETLPEGIKDYSEYYITKYGRKK